MSRRLRFQVKPNLNVATSAFEEAKSASLTHPPIAEPKPTVGKVADHIAPPVVDERIAVRSPSPRPPPPAAASASEESGTDYADTGSAPPPVVNEEADISRAATQKAPNLVTSTTTEVVTEAPNASSSQTLLVQQLSASTSMPPPPPPPPQPPPVQHVGNKRFDWRTMRNCLKGKKLDRSTFLMRDLIFWSPQPEDEEGEGTEDGDDTASMSSGSSGPIRKSRKRRYMPRFESPLPASTEKREKVEEAKPSAPQVKVNPDGSIAIDESSLVFDRRDQGTGTDFETVDETWGYGVGSPRRGPRLTSMSFRRNKLPGRGRMWKKFETDKFYRVLSFAGLDFTLMHELFSTRSRLELKRKYKRECNDDPARIDRALMSTTARHGPWADLKKMIIERGRISDDERSRALLDTAREMIEEEDERIELATGVRKPSVAEASRIAALLSKHGFGDSQFNRDDDISDEQLQEMAANIIKDLTKKEEIEKERLAKRQEADKQRQKYHVETRGKSKRNVLKSEAAANEPSPTTASV